MVATAFEIRFARCRERLFGYALALARDRDLAADLFQDCVVKAMSARNRPECEQAFRAWLFAILRNLWIDRLRSERRSREISDEAARGHQEIVPGSLESVIVNQMAVRQAMNLLTADHRDILGLVDVAGFSYEEAARILGVPRGTVMSRVARARRTLCDLLSDERVADFPPARRNGRDA